MKRLRWFLFYVVFLSGTYSLFSCSIPSNSNTDPNFHPGIPNATSATSLGILATSFVATAETTASTTPTDLTTLDEVSITLTATSTVEIDYTSMVTSVGCSASVENIINVDGVNDPHSSNYNWLSNGWSGAGFSTSVQTLTAGTHIIKAQHATSACSATWQLRLLKVTQTSILATNFVATAETTGSSTPIDLPTLDEVTVNLTSPTALIINYVATMAKPCTGTGINNVYIDGISDSNGVANYAVNGGTNAPGYLVYSPTLAAGTHTIDIQHSTDTCTVTFSNRSLSVLQAQPTVLASNFVPTYESTVSTTYTDLATLDQTSVTLSAPTNVIIQYNAVTSSTGCTPNPIGNIINVDGTNDLSTATTLTLDWGYSGASIVASKVTLSAGTHIIKVSHEVSSCTGSWFNRFLYVSQVP